VIRRRPWSDKCTNQLQVTSDQPLLYAFLFNLLFVSPHPLPLNVPSEVLHSPTGCSWIGSWKGPWLDNLNYADAFTFHVTLQSTMSLAKQLVPMSNPCNSKDQHTILKASRKQGIDNTKVSPPFSQLSWKGSRTFLILKRGGKCFCNKRNCWRTFQGQFLYWVGTPWFNV